MKVLMGHPACKEHLEIKEHQAPRVLQVL